MESRHGGCDERFQYDRSAKSPRGADRSRSRSSHDAGVSGGCLYFEDFRNPGGNDYHMDTWNNLVPLTRGGSSPAWMSWTANESFLFAQ
ncbi:hypothetical protein BON30_35645 [Cystobacter ferrugineus]|uniref:Uncharacterized protein n=1 Tax=Cystobacter ferrugineus TaxID=83449 RepID=A0A1L9B106_9BACT|nr:hypothetical protein BON30_35645 [Cystobacter ferrugineus]